jgi:hypothetical protein
MPSPRESGSESARKMAMPQSGRHGQYLGMAVIGGGMTVTTAIGNANRRGSVMSSGLALQEQNAFSRAAVLGLRALDARERSWGSH